MIDNDLLNALRMFLAGNDLLQPVTDDMPDDVYNALAFAQANDIGQFFNTDEFELALIENVQQIDFTYIDSINLMWGMF